MARDADWCGTQRAIDRDVDGSGVDMWRAWIHGGCRPNQGGYGLIHGDHRPSPHQVSPKAQSYREKKGPLRSFSVSFDFSPPRTLQ
jgi:hypothetical protein